MTRLLLLAFLASATLTFTACDNTPEEVVEAITPNVKASIDGASFETNIAIGVNAIVSVGITATKGNQVIVLNTPSIDVGVYTIDGATTNGTYTPNVTDSLNGIYAGYEGVIEITDVNSAGTQIQGNFNFKCINAVTLDTISITNGELNNIPIK